jgi:ATP-binding cassette subfamily B protein
MLKIVKMLSAKLQLKCVLLSILAIVGAYLVSLTPVYLGKVLDGITDGSNDLQHLVVYFAILFLATEATNIFRRVSVDRVSARFEENIRNDSIHKLLKLPIKELLAHGVSGELTSKINQAVSGASQLLKMFPNDILPAIFVGVFVVIQCIGQAPLVVALVMLGYIICTLTVSLMQIKSQRGIRENIIHKKTKLDGDICQSIAGIEQIRSLGAENAECMRLSPQTRGIRLTECKHHTIMGVFDVCKHIVKVAFFVTILIIGITLISKGSVTGGNVLAIVLLFQQLIKPIDEFYRFLDEISACSVKVGMLNDIMDKPVDIAFKISDSDIAFSTENIDIDYYVVWSPDEDKMLSKSKEVVFRTSQSTALVAKTGGGKSSLMKGLIRLYPLYGAVRLFGVDWKNISQQTLVRLVHYIPQAPFFFAGTVRDNLTYGLESIPSDNKLIEVLDKACVHDELVNLSKSLPTPLDYVVQENGKNFSGGQLKRLAITRAFLRTPKMYVFDETLANIDKQTITMILSNFEAYAKKIGAGIVHISHEQSIVSRCENIIKLELTNK